MTTHQQKSSHKQVWFDADVVDNGNGTITIPATTFWLRGTAYSLAEYTPTVGTGMFHLFIEKDGSSADYYLDTTGTPEPATFGLGIGSPMVAWRDYTGDAIHILRSVNA